MAKRFDLEKILAPVGGVVAKLQQRLDQLLAEAAMIREQIERFGGRVGTPKPAKAGKRAKGKRVRRSREDLEKQAGEVVKFIKAAGADGISAKELTAKFGKLAPSPKAFLKQYAPDQKVRATGAKSQTRYSG